MSQIQIKNCAVNVTISGCGGGSAGGSDVGCIENPGNVLVHEGEDVQEMFLNSADSNYYFPDNYHILLAIDGLIKDESVIEWHFKWSDRLEDEQHEEANVYTFNKSAMVQLDVTPDYVHSFSDVRSLEIWYEYPPLGFESAKTLIEFNGNGVTPLRSGSAVGSINSDDPPDIGFTTRTYQMQQDTITSRWKSLDFEMDLFVANTEAALLSRNINWRWSWSGTSTLSYPDLPDGLSVRWYGYGEHLNGGALAVALTPEMPCGDEGLAELGTFTVWCEIDGTVGASAELIFLNAGTVTC